VAGTTSCGRSRNQTDAFTGLCAPLQPLEHGD
jgi:hypothetical protein